MLEFFLLPIARWFGVSIPVLLLIIIIIILILKD